MSKYKEPLKVSARQRAMATRSLMLSAMIEINALEETLRDDDGESLAECVRALRMIANSSVSDGRSRGVARGALKRIGVAL